jgi:hypothetical protein
LEIGVFQDLKSLGKSGFVIMAMERLCPCCKSNKMKELVSPNILV